MKKLMILLLVLLNFLSTHCAIINNQTKNIIHATIVTNQATQAIELSDLKQSGSQHFANILTSIESNKYGAIKLNNNFTRRKIELIIFYAPPRGQLLEVKTDLSKLTDDEINSDNLIIDVKSDPQDARKIIIEPNLKK